MVVSIIVMSDSHGDDSVVEAIKSHYKGQVAAIFHNGDSELSVEDEIWSGINVVKGNCDFSDFPECQIVDVSGIKIIQTHGHLYGINFTWQRLDYWAEEEEADICLYGHLHVPDAVVRGKTLFLNPGSVSQPRGLVQEKLYAKVDIYPDYYHIEFRTLDHKVYDSLTKDLAR